MSYQKGGVITIESNEYLAGGILKDREPIVALPCPHNNWIIGGKAEVEQLIADLQEILKKL